MNGIPEIVCEIIFVLSGYLHHRTDFMTYDTYKQMMIGQIEDRNVASVAQTETYNKVGWKEDAEGIDNIIEELVQFASTFRNDRDAKATNLETVRARAKVIKKLQGMGIEMPGDEDFLNAYDKSFKRALLKQ